MICCTVFTCLPVWEKLEIVNPIRVSSGLRQVQAPSAPIPTALSNIPATPKTLPSLPPLPKNVTEKGIFTPSNSYQLAGTATAHKSTTFPKCVNLPRTEFSPIGSCRTSLTVKCAGAVGTTSTSMLLARNGLKTVSLTFRVSLCGSVVSTIARPETQRARGNLHRHLLQITKHIFGAAAPGQHARKNISSNLM